MSQPCSVPAARYRSPLPVWKTAAASPARSVGNAELTFALRGITPNPARGAFNVFFSLPSSKPATLAVYDVSGRQVVARSVGTLGGGLHSIPLGERGKLPAGLYVIKLSQAGRVATHRVAVIP